MSETDKTRWVKATIREDTYKTELRTDTHTIIADEPVNVGGTDLGPSPGDLIRMSLASCMAITMRMYANRKGFPVTAIEVKVFSEDVDGTLFTSIVRIEGSLDQSQRERMLIIGKKCPIHKLLINPIAINATLDPANPSEI